MCLSQDLSCEVGNFSHCRQSPQVFSISGLRLYFPMLEPSVVESFTQSTSYCLIGQAAALPTLLHNPQPHLVLQPPPCLESSPPSCPSPPLLKVWMNVSFLSPWLLDFHTLRFSVSSGCFLFLNCCPSFGCVRRHSVSTYTSILSGSPAFHFLTHHICLSIP